MSRDPSPSSQPPSSFGQSLALTIALAAVVFVVVLVLSAWAIPFVLWREFDNMYFHADNALVYANMTDFGSNHYRTGMHPGFSLFAAFLVSGLSAAVETPLAVRVLMALNAGVQVALLSVLMRRIGLGLTAITVFTALFLVSATLVFWHTIPETFAFGGTTLLIMLWIASRPAPGTGLLILGNVATMSMTMTNWMAAFYTTVWHRWLRWGQAVVLFAISGMIIVAIGILSKLTFPSAGYVGDFRRYLAWIRLPQPGDWPSFFGHSVVMPTPVYDLREGGYLAAVVEPSALGSGSPLGLPALALWAVLLALGIYATWRARQRALSTVLGLTALSQLGLHSFFSDGPFLFAAHYGPLLILVAAHAARLERIRGAVISGAAVLVLLVGYNNALVFQAMTDRFETDLLPQLQAEGVLMETVRP